MNNNINLIAFGTFGNPNGFRQTFFIGNKELSDKVKTFDLNTNAIKLLPNSKVYAIRKENINGLNSISYSIYNYAKEQNSDRSGTFIGSSILFINEIADESISISLLNDFNENLINKNVEKDVIKVIHSKDFSVSKPKDFDKATHNLRPIENINYHQFSNKNLVVYSEIKQDKLRTLFNNSLDLLNVYDVIYFTDNSEVAEYVHQKGMFKLVQYNGFEQEIENLERERKQKTESSISEFESEKQKLEDDKRKLIEEYKFQIEENEKAHRENSRKIEESKNELTQINQKYDSYSKKIIESINNLKSGQKLDVVRQLHNENKRIFIDSINQQTQPKFINKISKHVAKTELRQPFQPSQSNSFEQHNYNQEHRQRRKNRLDIFKLLTFILSLLLIVTLTYFLAFHTPDRNTELALQEEYSVPVAEEPKPEPIPLKELNPKPNKELSPNDYKYVAKKITKDMPIKEIVQIIFNANPSDVKSNYSEQLEEYSKLIIELNKDCFRLDSNKYFFSKDTLRHIPAYKK